MKPRLFDSHCHLPWSEPEIPVSEQLEAARAGGVDQLLCVATDLESARRCREIARSAPGVRASAGLHPNDTGRDAAALAELLSELDRLAGEAGWAAIGETGLDYYRDHAEPALQRVALDHQLALARRRRLPVILHCRHAAADLLAALRNHGGPVSGVMHCYSEGPDPLEGFLELGLHVSFAGNLTYPRSDDIRAAAALVPAERLLVETDAPFLAPQPVRGRRNQPAYVVHTVERLAELRGWTPAEAARTTRENAEHLFPPAD